MLTLCIDPGLTGDLALLDSDGVPELVADLARHPQPLARMRDGRVAA